MYPSPSTLEAQCGQALINGPTPLRGQTSGRAGLAACSSPQLAGGPGIRTQQKKLLTSMCPWGWGKLPAFTCVLEQPFPLCLEGGHGT